MNQAHLQLPDIQAPNASGADLDSRIGPLSTPIAYDELEPCSDGWPWCWQLPAAPWEAPRQPLAKCTAIETVGVDVGSEAA